MKSMTGFGVARGSLSPLARSDENKGKQGKRKSKSQPASEQKVPTGNVDVEISVRSVNGRFLEIRFHLPREYFPFENELKTIVSQKIKRGTVDIFISRRSKSFGKKQKVGVNSELASEYFNAYKALGKTLKIKAEPSLESILRLPGVLALEEEPDVHEHEFATLSKIMNEALAKQTDERVREGAALKRELLVLVSELMQIVEQIEKHREEANKNLEQKLLTKFEQKNKSLSVEPQRFAQEVMLYLEKSDINEEVVRLREHLHTYKTALSKGTAEGKQLDFYTQELLREINTIGSKSQVAAITALVVQAKTFIERLREQVQNLE